MTRTFFRYGFLLLGIILTALWIVFTVRSPDTMPWNNEWLVALILLLVVAFVGLPQHTLPLFGRTSRERDAGGEAKAEPEYPFSTIRALITFAALFFGGTWLLMIPVVTSEGAPGSVVVEHDGRDVALVAYDRYGPQGMLQIGTRNFFPQGVVAIDLETAKHLWVARIADDNFAGARVVAANEDYAYVANLEGLRVLDMDDGHTVARPGEIEGLDEVSVGVGAFVYDPDTDRILARTTNGLAQLRVGALSATPAMEEDGYNWEPMLGDEYFDVVSTFATYEEAVAGDAFVELSDDQLVIQRRGEEEQDLTGAIFDGGSLVVNRAPPARATQQFRVAMVETDPLLPPDIYDAVGASGGYVVVTEITYGSNAHTVLTTVSLETGDLLDTITVAEEPTGGSTSVAGSSVITLRERAIGSTSPVVLISPEGQFSTSMIGRADFFGTAL